MIENQQNLSKPKTPHIGAFVLETLTLGMYGDPRHTLREYVQNSFDSIRAAKKHRFLQGQGQVDIYIENDSIRIKDNGIGVSAAQAWSTLSSIGASKKDRANDAGFRGIGRLAGMAYCEKLTFRTTFPGETVLSTLTFDCAKLTAAMNPDAGGDTELATLLGDSVEFAPDPRGAATEDHFFEVTMHGLKGAPEALTKPSLVCEYLSQTVPVDFNPAWVPQKEIAEKFKEYFGATLEAIQMLVHYGGASHRIYRSYGDDYALAKGTAKIRQIKYFSDVDNQYWGWIGYLTESGAVVDESTRGVRMRVRNIQVDGTDIFETLFSEVKPSYARFSSYYVGEFHIWPNKVVPNARRDGFEETEQWIGIKQRLRTNVCQTLATDAYEFSKIGQRNIVGVVEEIEALVKKSQDLLASSETNYDLVVDLMASAKKMRRRALATLKTVGDIEDTAREQGESMGAKGEAGLRKASLAVQEVEERAMLMIGQLLGDDTKIEGLKHRLLEQLMQDVLSIVKEYVDAQEFQKIRNALKKRFG